MRTRRALNRRGQVVVEKDAEMLYETAIAGEKACPKIGRRMPRARRATATAATCPATANATAIPSSTTVRNHAGGQT
jgi:hypothetical protein